MVLEKSDPGYRYNYPHNVQCSSARRHIGGWIAQSAIFSAVTERLDTTQSNCGFKWLLEGGEKEGRRIGPHMGMASKLLYLLAQVTYISARFAEVCLKTRCPMLHHWADSLQHRILPPSSIL